MSLMWLQVGQCGNQIGQEWWQILANNGAEADRQFRDANIILGQRGRGNNWAYGKKRDQSLLERTMESFRKELERRDCYSGTVILHSLCGGTGSGLGSRLCQEIRDNYPAGHLLSVTTAPHETGDTPLQHYNSLLCLSYLQSLSVLAVARNSQEYSFLLSRDSVLMKLKQSYHCVSWNPFPIQCWTDPQNILDPSSNSHSLTVCANHSSAGDLVSGIVGKSHTMYNAGGYLHWYRRYGCEDEDFQAAFNTLDSVVEEYNSLGQQ
uniref:Tubulin/FtsZ GTPase domain-containing protein n=1 Tax=Pyxicephalus adspersus TaxID=30357 RepID=A0AAV3AEG0_PYXAD|nr:TPA: hypothetical protein GDO54_012886 [Pyxicephalus adspersus]